MQGVLSLNLFEDIKIYLKTHLVLLCPKPYNHLPSKKGMFNHKNMVLKLTLRTLAVFQRNRMPTLMKTEITAYFIFLSHSWCLTLSPASYFLQAQHFLQDQ